MPRIKFRICEHLVISHLTSKKVYNVSNKLTAIKELVSCCNYSSSFKDFSILTTESSDFKLKIYKSQTIESEIPVQIRRYLQDYFNNSRCLSY